MTSASSSAAAPRDPSSAAAPRDPSSAAAPRDPSSAAAPRELDLGAPRRIHIVAIGGSAMNVLARYLVQLGHTVTGSDARDSKTLRALASEGITVHVGHDASLVAGGDRPDYVVASTAVRTDNPELVAARDLGIPTLWRGEAMGAIVATKPKVAVISGTHGKTSTTAMVAAILDHAQWHASRFIGGTPVGAPAAKYDSEGEWIVVEGDESDHSFLEFRRDAALVTNVEADHLDKWGDLAALHTGFDEFVRTAPGPVVVCADHAGSRRLRETRSDAVTYGFDPDADYHATAYEPTARGCRIEVTRRDHGPQAPLELRLRGRDMATNAVGAAAFASELGVPWVAVAAALAGFEGVARRFQPREVANGADCYDDYAHTPTEIAATLARAKEGPWRRVIAVCQPHRYTRISRHWREFADAFVDADHVVVAGLDGAFEEPIAGVDGRLVVRAVLDAHPDTALAYLPDWDALADVPWRYARPGDLVVTLGCGTITEIHDTWQARAS